MENLKGATHVSKKDVHVCDIVKWNDLYRGSSGREWLILKKQGRYALGMLLDADRASDNENPVCVHGKFGDVDFLRKIHYNEITCIVGTVTPEEMQAVSMARAKSDAALLSTLDVGEHVREMEGSLSRLVEITNADQAKMLDMQKEGLRKDQKILELEKKNEEQLNQINSLRDALDKATKPKWKHFFFFLFPGWERG